MKHNLILLLFVSFLSLACNNDDNPNSVNNENSQIIGEWECYKEILDGITYTADGCERPKLILSAGGKAMKEFYKPNVNNGNCEIYASQDIEWKHINGSTYRLSLVGMSDIGGDDFTINNNEFIINLSSESIEYWRKIE